MKRICAEILGGFSPRLLRCWGKRLDLVFQTKRKTLSLDSTTLDAAATLATQDPELHAIIEKERVRQVQKAAIAKLKWYIEHDSSEGFDTEAVLA